MRISVSSDLDQPVARALVADLRGRGHEVITYGALSPGDDPQWGVRAALCTDAYTAEGARRWNDANVLALSLRLTSEPLLAEILEAWFTTEPSPEEEDRQNVERVTR